jgi:hypothetical protein
MGYEHRVIKASCPHCNRGVGVANYLTKATVLRNKISLGGTEFQNRYTYGRLRNENGTVDPLIW